MASIKVRGVPWSDGSEEDHIKISIERERASFLKPAKKTVSVKPSSLTRARRSWRRCPSPIRTNLAVTP